MRMEPMCQGPEARLIEKVDVFYMQDKDVGLVCFGFDSRFVDPPKYERLIRLATRGGFAVIDPERLSSTDRGFFYQDYLRRYSVSTIDQDNPTAALAVLGRQLGLIAGKPQSELQAPAALDAPTTDVGHVRRRLGSEGRRQRVEIPLAMAQPQQKFGRQATTNTVAPHHTKTIELSLEDSGVSELDMLDQIGLGPAGKQPRARGKAKRSQRMSTIPARPSNQQAPSPQIVLPLPPRGDADQPTPAPTRRKRRASSVPLINNTGETDLVRVRYQRGDSWMPARLRNLTTRDIRLAASAAPPAGSTLRVSVTIGDRNVVLTGTVVEVVNTEGSPDGSTTFRLEFRKIGNRERERLVALLRKANRSGMSLTPPPARRDRRFAISWPIAIVSEGRRFNASALDISERGLFLATTTLIRSSQIIFGMPLDRKSATVRGRASVARKVNEHMARSRGLSLGYGLQIEDFSVEDDEQYEKFLIRVRRRSQLHILVAGDGDRSLALANCFESAGYAVSKAGSVEAMLHRTAFDSSAPDVAVLEGSNLSADAQLSFESTFRKHQVPMLHVGQQAPILARNSLDQMVAV